jgi:hypothetical protein
MSKSSIILWQLLQKVSGSRCVICTGVHTSEPECDELESDAKPSGDDLVGRLELGLCGRLSLISATFLKSFF